MIRYCVKRYVSIPAPVKGATTFLIFFVGLIGGFNSCPREGGNLGAIHVSTEL